MANVTDLNDTLVSVDILGETMQQSAGYFATLSNLANKIATDPCVIRCEKNQPEENAIHAEFDFCCAAEKIIFQLNHQFNSKYKFRV